MTSFTTLGVPARLADVLNTLQFDTPTPIQQATLPDSLAGRDILGRGRTGSGKTLAFLLPLVARLTGGKRARSGAPRALILAPTRELVAQIDEALRPLAQAAKLSSRTVFGGVGQGPQVAALKRGTDIIVACPGRLEDLIEQGHCTLADIEITVLDEADHMADLGFLPSVRRLLGRTPSGGQRMLFSATLDKAIDSLVKQFLTDPRVHQADSVQAPVSTMSHHVLQVARESRLPVLVDLTSAPGRTVVFTRTKYGAKSLAKQLNRNGVPAVELHGNLSQNARTRNLDAFHTGRATALVATDIAARGIHVDDVALVIHADPPVDHKAYLHRSGRTARAGNSGTVVTLSMADQAQEVRQLTRAAGIKPTITKINSTDDPVLGQLAPGTRVIADQAEIAALAAVAPTAQANGASRSGGRSRSGGNSRPAGGSRSDGRARGQGGRRQQDNRRPARAEADGGQPNGSGGRRRRRRSAGSSGNGSNRPEGSGRQRSSSSDGRDGRSRSASPTSSRPHSAAAFSAGRR
ncbi:DEAD/DEAH box helicase [Microlunatus soli]|uniref:Superfamily II DNA and RNA helicase n=1 Tax=Microlunatus soli TaxID=630515 RepID=A0A1H1SFF9_9ACTN|nr:DEAD/DEAH box helicase [Microlunatus soli]SDS46810.1 Superfamily II DNA and RNA helicase [Microlunatus soli]